MTALEIANLIINRDPEWRYTYGIKRNTKIESYGLDPNEVKSLVNKIRNKEINPDGTEYVTPPNYVYRDIELKVDNAIAQSRFILNDSKTDATANFIEDKEDIEPRFDFSGMPDIISELDSGTMPEIKPQFEIGKMPEVKTEIIEEKVNIIPSVSEDPVEQSEPVDTISSINIKEKEQEEFGDHLIYHTAKRNETLKSIADSYKVKVIDLMKWNNIKNANASIKGKRIKIKGGK